jgi:hypothetical protein
LHKWLIYCISRAKIKNPNACAGLGFPASFEASSRSRASGFKQVFDLGQTFLSDVAMIAARAQGTNRANRTHAAVSQRSLRAKPLGDDACLDPARVDRRRPGDQHLISLISLVLERLSY